LRFESSLSAEPDAHADAPPVSRFATSEDGRQLLGLGAATVTLLQAGTHAPRTMPLPAEPLAAAWSPLAQRWLVATADARLLLIDPVQPDAVQSLTLTSAATTLAVFDGGRHAIAGLGESRAAVIVDVASATLTQTVPTVAAVGEIAFSEAFAYLHSAEDAQATLVSLADARQGRARPVTIAAGNAGAAGSPDRDTRPGARTLVQAPDGMSMLIANRHDGHIYQYAEGMMAPVGSFSNYKRSAASLMLLNHGFESLGAGRYRTTLRHAQGGAHELVVSGVQPRFANCLALALPEVPDARREQLAARPRPALVRAEPVDGGHALAVEVRLDDAASGAPLAAVSDLVLLAFDRRSGWQRRVPLVEKSAGRYAALVPLAESAASFDLLVSSATQDLPFGNGRIGAYPARQP
jgi:hypothetical protein